MPIIVNTLNQINIHNVFFKDIFESNIKTEIKHFFPIHITA
jgi:hypothetical protein